LSPVGNNHSAFVFGRGHSAHVTASPFWWWQKNRVERCFFVSFYGGSGRRGWGGGGGRGGDLLEGNFFASFN